MTKSNLTGFLTGWMFLHNWLNYQITRSSHSQPDWLSVCHISLPKWQVRTGGDQVTTLENFLHHVIFTSGGGIFASQYLLQESRWQIGGVKYEYFTSKFVTVSSHSALHFLVCSSRWKTRESSQSSNNNLQSPLEYILWKFTSQNNF